MTNNYQCFFVCFLSFLIVSILFNLEIADSLFVINKLLCLDWTKHMLNLEQEAGLARYLLEELSKIHLVKLGKISINLYFLFYLQFYLFVGLIHEIN